MSRHAICIRCQKGVEYEPPIVEVRCPECGGLHLPYRPGAIMPSVPLALLFALLLASCDSGEPPGSIEPVVTITFPALGGTFMGDVTLRASASDTDAVVRLIVEVDGEPVDTVVTASCETLWHGYDAVPGPHTISARAQDVEGNVGFAAPVTIATTALGLPVQVHAERRPETLQLYFMIEGGVTSATLDGVVVMKNGEVVERMYLGSRPVMGLSLRVPGQGTYRSVGGDEWEVRATGRAPRGTFHDLLLRRYTERQGAL